MRTLEWSSPRRLGSALRWSLALAAAVLLASSAIALPAAAQPRRGTSQATDTSSTRIVVAPFRGARAASARRLLISNLAESGYTVVPDSEVASTARRLGISSRPSRGDYLSIAAELHASVVIEGRVSRARRSWNLRVEVLNGADGASLGSASWGGRAARAVDGVGRNGAERLGAFIGRGQPVVTTAASSGEPQWYQEGYHDDAETPLDDERPGQEGAEAPSRQGRYDVGRIMASGGTMWRSFSTIVDAYGGHHGATDPLSIVHQERSYTSPGIGHFELGIEGEFYPGALDDQPFPYLGIVAAFRHSLGIVSIAEAEDPALGDVTLGTDQMDVRAGLRGRYRFGSNPGDFMLFADLGFALSTFTFDLEALSQVRLASVIPPMEYYSIEVGLGFDVGLVPDALSLSAYGRARIGVALGVQARNVWGIDTKPANGVLVGLELRHDAVWITRGLFAALRFEYFQYITQFSGQAGCYGPCSEGTQPYLDRSPWEVWPSRDPNAPNEDVTGGARDPVSDHNVRWGLYLGYAFE